MSEHTLETMPFEAYQNAAGVSNSMLTWISHPKTPAHFKARWIDKTVVDKDTPARQFGRLLHSALLEPDDWRKHAVLLPADAPKYPTDAQRKAKTPSPATIAAIKWWENWEQSNAGKTVIETDTEKQIDGMIDSLMRRPLARKIIENSARERCAFVNDNGLMLKSRFDLWPQWSNANLIADIKTCDDADPESAGKDAWGYYYWRQAAFYRRVSRLLGADRPVFLFIFVEKQPPYEVGFYTPDDILMEYADRRIAGDLQNLRNCHETNRWPGYPESMDIFTLPGWARKEIEAAA